MKSFSQFAVLHSEGLQSSSAVCDGIVLLLILYWICV